MPTLSNDTAPNISQTRTNACDFDSTPSVLTWTLGRGKFMMQGLNWREHK